MDLKMALPNLRDTELLDGVVDVSDSMVRHPAEMRAGSKELYQISKVFCVPSHVDSLRPDSVRTWTVST